MASSDVDVGVGGDVEGICGKCKETTWHIVLAKADEKIVKVECKACGAQHRLRVPGGAKKKKAAGTKKKTTRARKPPPPPEPPKVDPDLSKPVRPYDMAELYEVGDRIDHPRFGAGLVEEAGGAGRIVVYFPEGRRKLAVPRPDSRLAHAEILDEE